MDKLNLPDIVLDAQEAAVYGSCLLSLLELLEKDGVNLDKRDGRAVFVAGLKEMARKFLKPMDAYMREREKSNS